MLAVLHVLNDKEIYKDNKYGTLPWKDSWSLLVEVNIRGIVVCELLWNVAKKFIWNHLENCSTRCGRASQFFLATVKIITDLAVFMNQKLECNLDVSPYSWFQIQGIGGAMFLYGSSGKESTSKVIQLLNWRPEEFSFGFVFPCRLLAEGWL